MSDKITLIVRFKLQEAANAEFIGRLKDVFAHIEREETFVEASLQQDREDPTSLLVYEVWRETPEPFMKNQMTREYRKGYEEAVSGFKVERIPSWYRSSAEWKRAPAYREKSGPEQRILSAVWKCCYLRRMGNSAGRAQASASLRNALRSEALDLSS
jgi:quinol monooxygenase YgiN